MSADLEAYGWRRHGLVWRRPRTHLTVVPDITEPTRASRPTRVTKHHTGTCACGAPMTETATRCKTCYLDSFENPGRPVTLPNDGAVEWLLTVLGWHLATTPAASPVPLAAELCDDCGCLLALNDTTCPACLVWAERNAVEWSWAA